MQTRTMKGENGTADEADWADNSRILRIYIRSFICIICVIRGSIFKSAEGDRL